MNDEAQLRVLFRARVLTATGLHKAQKAARDDDDREIVESVIGKGQDKLAALAAALIAGTLSRSAFVEQATAILTTTIKHGAALGGASGKEAAALADELLSARADHLSDFADDLDAADPAAGTGISAAQAAARARLWAGLAFTASEMAKVRGSDEDEWEWELDPDAAHCDDPDGNDCPTFAENGPYKTEDLPAYPADGTTPCNGRCRCRLKAKGGD